jgi:hypothetical protein
MNKTDKSIADKVSKPEISRENFEKEVQGSYVDLIKEFDVTGIETLMKYTGFKPDVPETLVQEAYLSHLADSSVPYHFEYDRMEKLTGVKPVLPEDKINETFMKYAKEKDLFKIDLLSRYTGMKPSQEVIRLAISK